MLGDPLKAVKLNKSYFELLIPTTHSVNETLQHFSTTTLLKTGTHKYFPKKKKKKEANQLEKKMQTVLPVSQTT